MSVSRLLQGQAKHQTTDTNEPDLAKLVLADVAPAVHVARCEAGGAHALHVLSQRLGGLVSGHLVSEWGESGGAVVRGGKFTAIIGSEDIPPPHARTCTIRRSNV